MCRALRVFAYLAIVILRVCSAVGQNPTIASADQIWCCVPYREQFER